MRQNHRWTPEQEQIITDNPTMSAVKIKIAYFAHIQTITPIGIDNKRSRLNAATEHGKQEWTQERLRYFYERLELSNKELLLPYGSKDLNQMRYNLNYGVYVDTVGKLGKKIMPYKVAESLAGPELEIVPPPKEWWWEKRGLGRAPRASVKKELPKNKINAKKLVKNQNQPPRAESPIKRPISSGGFDDKQFLQFMLAIEVIKNASPELIKIARDMRSQKEDNPELVALWDYLCKPQAKDLAPGSKQRVLCKRLRKATEKYNRILRKLPDEKSANVSTFQYNCIRHICGIRVTSFADQNVHGSLAIELQALVNAILEVKNNP